MSTPMIETPGDSQQDDTDIDPIISRLTGFVDDLDSALADRLDRPDRQQIIKGIAGAICVQELTRMMVTKINMDAGIRSAIDAATVRSDWQTLCRHYAGSKYAAVLDNGVTQLEKLSPEQAEEIIYAIRRSIEPDLNWAMEEQVVKIGLALPVVGKIGIGNLRFNLRGTRVAMRSLRGRLIRRAVQAVLWLAVAAGTVHWTSWTFFDEPYLVTAFVGLAKLTQFALLMSTTLLVWVLVKARQDSFNGMAVARFPSSSASLLGPSSSRDGSNSSVGWCSAPPVQQACLEAPAKLLMPFFLVSGGIAAWVSGRVFKGTDKNGE